MRHWCKLVLVFALAAFAPALEVVAQTPEKQLASGRALLRAGKNDAALAKLEEIAAQHPGLPGVDHELGVAYYRKADYLSAITHLQRAVEADKGDRDALQLLGLSYYLSGQPAQAIPYLQQFHAESSGGSDAAYVLAVCYALTKDYSQALNAISKLYNLPAGSVASRLIFARVLLAQGLDPVAEEQAREVLKQARNAAGAHFILGQVYLYRSDIEHAIGELRAELEINPTYALAFTRLGDAYTRAGKLDEAQAALQRAIWLDASYAESYVLLAKVLLRKRDLMPGVQLLQRALSIDPSDYTAHHLLAEAYRQLGQAELAGREMQIGMRLEQQQTRLNRK